MNVKSTRYCCPCYRRRRIKQRDENGMDTESSDASRYSGEVRKSKFGCLTCNEFICCVCWKTYEH